MWFAGQTTEFSAQDLAENLQRNAPVGEYGTGFVLERDGDGTFGSGHRVAQAAEAKAAREVEQLPNRDPALASIGLPFGKRRSGGSARSNRPSSTAAAATIPQKLFVPL